MNHPRSTVSLAARLLSAVLFSGVLGVANLLHAHGDLHERIIGITQRIERDTNNASLLVQRGELHREHRDWKSATADYDRAEQLDLKLVRIDFFRARMFNDMGELATARSLLNKHLTANTNDSEAFVLRARVLAKLGERGAAVQDFSRAIGLMHEPQPEFFIERAELLVTDKRVDEALRSLDEGMKRLGAIASLQTRALDLELSQTNFPGAIARLDGIIAQAPRKEAWLARKGELELQSGRTNDAKKSFEASLAAVNALPARLREDVAMIDLQSRVTAELEKIERR